LLPGSSVKLLIGLASWRNADGKASDVWNIYMNAAVLEKLWKRSHGRIPHLNPPEFAPLVQLANELERSTGKYWGLVDRAMIWKDRSLVHCFNFGNMSIKMPWSAEAVNLGLRFSLTIKASGTIRPRRSFRTLLHQVESPFLVFELERSPFVEERLQPGLLLTDPQTARMRTNCEVVMLPGSTPPREGLFYYFLMKRITFTAEEIEPFDLPDAFAQPLPRFKMRWNDPMYLESGCALLMLEKDRWVWGVVLG
jgi:hypothetical protein